MFHERKHSKLGMTAVAAAAAAALTVAGCSAPAPGPEQTDQPGQTQPAAMPELVIAASSQPNSLDPFLESVGPIGNMYHYLAYDSITRIDSDGKVVPGLATEWAYTDDAQTTLELTIREGVTFSDGSDLDAEDVAASLNYGREKGVNGPGWLGVIDSVTADGATKVVIKSSRPNDSLPYVLSQRMLLGNVVSAEAAADPESLKTATYGSGPYMLDGAQTVANSAYVYVPNPNHWDPSHIKFSKVTINVVADYNAALQAVQSGAADLMSGNQPTAAAAKEAGLEVATAPFGLTGIQISDRNGEVVPALADVRVRQALFYAINREAIANAVFGGFSTPMASMLIEGFDGYTADDVDAYPYDMAKAQQLLTEAGYADGFSFDISVPTANNTHLMAQAVVESWAQLGITANLQTYTDLGQLTTDILAKKYPVSAFNYGALPSYTQSGSFFNGGATQFNPWDIVDPEIDKALLDAASGATPEAVNEAYAKAWHRSLVDLAWITNVYTRDGVTIYDPNKIADVLVSSQNPIPDFWLLRPAG